MKKFMTKFISLTLTAVLILAAAGCSSKDQGSTSGDGTVEEGNEATEEGKIINVGVTDSLGGLNPFVMDQTEINKYAVGLMFLPLMELDKDMNFQGMLADSITTEDNVNFVVGWDACYGRRCGIYGPSSGKPCCK